jgi:hypothetical protein
MVIGLNPSTATEVKNDPTVKRCMSFAQQWGFDAMCMTNLFGFRATKPEDMLSQSDPAGPLNDQWLATIAQNADGILAAWGTIGKFENRAHQVLSILKRNLRSGVQIQALELNQDNSPKHPLYVRANIEPVPYPINHAVAGTKNERKKLREP